MLCSVRHDTALFDLPPTKTGKKDRPKVRNEKLTLKDFALSPIEDTDYSVGSRKVMTKIFGKPPAHAIVTAKNQIFLFFF